MISGLAGGAGELVEPSMGSYESPPSFIISAVETRPTEQLNGSRDYMLSYDRYSLTHFVYAPTNFVIRREYI